MRIKGDVERGSELRHLVVVESQIVCVDPDCWGADPEWRHRAREHDQGMRRVHQVRRKDDESPCVTVQCVGVVDGDDDRAAERFKSFEHCAHRVIARHRPVEHCRGVTETGATEAAPELGDELSSASGAVTSADVHDHRLPVTRKLLREDGLAVPSRRLDNGDHTAGQSLDQPRSIYQSRKQIIAPRSSRVSPYRMIARVAARLS